MNKESNYSGLMQKYEMKILIAILTVSCIGFVIYIEMVEQGRNNYHVDLNQSAVTQKSIMSQESLEHKMILFWTPNTLPDQSSSFNCFPYQCQFTKNRSQFSQSDGVIFRHFGSKYCIYIFIYFRYLDN